MIEVDEDEFHRLLKRNEWLDALEAAGVYNWQGMDEAIRIREEWRREAAQTA